MHGLCASQNGNHVDDRMRQKSTGNASSKVIWMVRGLKRDQSARCVDCFLLKKAVVWMIGWKPARWRCGCSAQMTELACWCRSSMAVGCFRRCSLEDSPRVTCCWCVSSMGSVLRAGPLDGEEYGEFLFNLQPCGYLWRGIKSQCVVWLWRALLQLAVMWVPLERPNLSAWCGSFNAWCDSLMQ